MATALFLDRDGVINEEKDGSYIFSLNEFLLYDGALTALVQLSRSFDYTFVVTNQRGVGRGLMSEAALQEIHEHLIQLVTTAGGRIDAIYFAPSMQSDHPDRKPNTGMAIAAKKQFPTIDFSTSVMVGNNLSDMQFGKNMGMRTIFLHTTKDKVTLPHVLIDEQYPSLMDYAVSRSGDSK